MIKIVEIKEVLGKKDVERMVQNLYSNSEIERIDFEIVKDKTIVKITLEESLSNEYLKKCFKSFGYNVIDIEG